MIRQELSFAVSCACKALKGPNVAGSDLILLAAENGTLEVSAQSSVMKVRALCNGMDPETNFKCAVKASLLASVLDRMPTSDVDLNLLQPGGLLVSCAIAKMVLPIGEYTAIGMDKNDTEYETTVVKDLAKYTSQVVHALGNAAMHPMMGAVHLEIFDNGGIQVTALDGYRISTRNTSGKEAKKVTDYVIYGRELNEALKMVGDGDVTLCKPRSGNYIRIAKEGLEIFINLVDGEYFNLGRYRERKFPIRLGAQKSALESALDLVKIFSKRTLVDVSNDGLTLQSEDALGDSQINVPAKVYGLEDGKTLSIAFNAEYLSAALKSISSDIIFWHLRTPESQCCITDGKNAIEIVLPVQVRRNNK